MRIKYGVNYREAFETTKPKQAVFETLNDANEFKRVLGELGYITFKPYEVIDHMAIAT